MEEPFLCPYCETELVYDPESQRDHSEYSPSYDCPKCSRRFILANHLDLTRKKWQLYEIQGRTP